MVHSEPGVENRLRLNSGVGGSLGTQQYSKTRPTILPFGIVNEVACSYAVEGQPDHVLRTSDIQNGAGLH
jgi:hypothetical protein